eukprot:jgi/Chlat1/4476/Chrsp29S04420
MAAAVAVAASGVGSLSCVVVGSGPGLGAAAARRFAAGGYGVGVVSRTESHLQELALSIESDGGRALSLPADVSDRPALEAAFTRAEEKLGPIDVLVFNASGKFPYPPPAFTSVSVNDFEASWKSQTLGAFHACQLVLPGMVARKKGTIIFTGATAAIRGSAGFSTLAVPKFGTRALAQCLAREYGPQGIHVVHAIIDGMISTPRARAMMPDRDVSTMLSPEAIAEEYWKLHTQDKSAWTQELDLRPYCEKF